MEDLKTKFNKLEDPLTVNEVSSLFRFHRDTVLRWCRSGEIKAQQIGNRGEWRIPKKSIKQLLG